jgi:hypothetical protein
VDLSEHRTELVGAHTAELTEPGLGLGTGDVGRRLLRFGSCAATAGRTRGAVLGGDDAEVEIGGRRGRTVGVVGIVVLRGDLVGGLTRRGIGLRAAAGVRVIVAAVRCLGYLCVVLGIVRSVGVRCVVGMGLGARVGRVIRRVVMVGVLALAERAAAGCARSAIRAGWPRDARSTARCASRSS